MRLSLVRVEAPERIEADKPNKTRARWRVAAQFMEAM
jgi:hypothetical protein